MNIRVTPHFERAYRKLPERITQLAKEKESIFRIDPSDPRLRTHKLTGQDHGSWAFWINYHYRIKFIFLKNDEVLFLDVGTHDIYRR